MTTIEKLTQRFEDPINVYGRIYYLRDYMTIQKFDEISDIFKIYYFTQRPSEYITEKITFHLLKIFNEVEVLPQEIEYLLPNNKKITEYTPFTVTFELQDCLIVEETKDFIIGNVPTEMYIKIYQSRYGKIPLLQYDKKEQPLEIKHSWIWKIVFK